MQRANSECEILFDNLNEFIHFPFFMHARRILIKLKPEVVLN